MTNTLYFDTETYSETPIKNGTYVYAASSEVMIATYALNDGPVQLWDATTGEPMPFDLRGWLDDPDVVVKAHNSMFDRNVLRLGNLQIEVPIRRWRCTMVKALAHALPGSLDKLCGVLGVGEGEAKIKDGKKLIQLFCKPMPKNSKLRRATHETHPEEWKRFCGYAVSDIVAMRACDKKLPDWNYSGQELELWFMDQMINDRGFLIDLDLANGALKAVDKEQASLKDQTLLATDGQVTSATKRDQMLAHILEYYGIDLPDMQSATLERRIADPELPEPLKELLRIRLQATTSSTSKYKALVKAVSADGRLRGTLQFDGASRTRRDAGRVFQPQNLPSRGLLPDYQIDVGIELLKEGNADAIFENVMKLTSSCIRGCLIPSPGKKYVVADLANIEGRDAAWLAGEDWKLQAFRDYDAGTGPDLYKLAYAKSFRINHLEVDKNQRAIGKVLELMLGYAGGVGAFMTGAAGYGFDIEELGILAYDTIPADVMQEADDFYIWLTEKKNGNAFGLSRRAFTVCDSLKRLWRAANPAISSYWKELEAQIVAAIQNPGVTFTARRVKVRRDGMWLRIGMPSGRALCYPSPKVDDDGKISYMGMHQYTRKWQRIHTHGGRAFENICQSLARDVLFDAMPNIEAHGYEIVLRVHDEVVTEAPDSPEFNPDHLSSLLSTNPPWALDMPLAAAGFEGYRYRK